ncbi:MAG: type II toxin-antitoxin system HicB family antitoxin [Candidatus Woykebacteria bacterium]
MKVLNYTVYLQKAPEGGYIISAPALPGCTSQGETKDEALSMIKDAIEGYIASLKKHREPIPTDKAEIEKVSVSV